VDQRRAPVHVTARHIPALDGVRGVAILVVLVHNASWVLDASAQLPTRLLGAVTTTGWIGVQLFFVLSGFLITGILIDTRRREGYFRSFYTRRVLRIFPLYYAFLVVALGIAPFFASPSWSSFARAREVWYWTYMANWHSAIGPGIPGLTHFWSLAVEEQFYLVWPLLVYVLSTRSLTALCAILIASGPFVRLGLHAAGLPPSTGYEFTIARWDALAAGGLLAILMAEGRGRERLSKALTYVGVFSSVALAAFLAINRGFSDEDWPVVVVGQSVVLGLFSWLIFVAAAGTTRAQQGVQRVLAWRWLRFFGKYSYAIYVFHWPVDTIAAHYLGGAVNGADDAWRLLRWAAYVSGVGALSTALALASWHLLEKPFLDLKDRLAPRAVRSQAIQGAGAG
jgi:peptidoglycan/LPS O-acetylase OafA/YrhL